MEEPKRFILFIVLSTIILMSWEYFYSVPRREEAAKIASEMQMENANTQAKINAAINAAKANESITEAKTIVLRKDVIAEDGRIKIRTEKLTGSFSLSGARMDDITLNEYNKVLNEEGDKVDLLSPSDTLEAYFAEFGWLSTNSNVITPNTKSVWKANNDILSVKNPVVLTWDNGSGIVFTRTIEIDDNYMFTITQDITNNTDEEITLLPYGLISQARADKQTIYISHEGPIAVLDDILEEISYDDMKEEDKREIKNKQGWIGIADKYWLVAIIPPHDSTFDINFTHSIKNNQHRYQADFMGKPYIIKPHDEISVMNYFFAGAKKVKLLDEYSAALNIPLFDRAVDFGWLYFLTKPMSLTLKFFYGMLGNFGLAVLLLTVVIKTLLFPLASKSYRSMARMRKFMPEMHAMRERYKDDKVKMNQEIMAFYKENRINPMSGCLPMLVQIPIFFSLYKTLYVTIEMRHAPFYGWIHNLSAPDPTNIMQLFGLIDWTPPAFLPAIGVLPVLFALSMYLQQKLNPAPTDPTQAMMMKWLPVIFLFLFAKFPAGLVLYWVWNNMLSILQQWIITRRIDEGGDGKFHIAAEENK